LSPVAVQRVMRRGGGPPEDPPAWMVAMASRPPRGAGLRYMLPAGAGERGMPPQVPPPVASTEDVSTAMLHLASFCGSGGELTPTPDAVMIDVQRARVLAGEQIGTESN